MTNDQRDAMIAQIHEAMAEQSALLRVLARESRRYDKTLFGNGRPGICQVLDQVATRQAECQARQSSRSTALPAWVSIAVTVIGMGMSTAVAVFLAS